MTAIARDISYDQRNFQRVRVNLHGRFMTPDRKEYPCQIVEMSPGNMVLLTEEPCNLGDKIVVYVDVLGRIEGHISRLLEEGFALGLKISQLKQERLADKLTWLTNQGSPDNEEDRMLTRLAPSEPHSKITLPDGRSYECHIIDISLSGAAVSAPICPDVNTVVTLGKMQGKVVRILDDGFAIEFFPITPETHLEHHF